MSAQTTITQLPLAGPITGTEAVPIVQGGVTVQTTTSAIAGSPTQTYTYLTVAQTPALANSRYVGVTNGLVITDGGSQGLFNISTTGALLSLVNSGTGFQVKTSATALTPRSIAVSGSGLSISNGSGVSGDPTISLTGQILNFANASFNGLVVLSTAGGITSATITGTTSQIAVTNGNGISGNPTIGLADNAVLPGTGSLTLPSGTTAQQPVSSVGGMMRYDTTQNAFYGYSSGSWRQFSLAGGVTQIDTGTGLTGGPITSTGTISIANTAVTAGSYGSATQVGTFTVNAQGQLTLAGNTTITAGGIGAVASVSGTANEITATGTTNVTLSLPSALTFTGKTVTGGAFNMTSATVGSDTVTTNTATQTLTNKTISGSTNTLFNIANASLTNSSVTYNGVAVALGASGTITASTTNALTVSTGLQLNTGTTFDGSAAKTISIDSTVATLTGTQTLINKTMSGASNTFSSIPNSALTNSTISGVALGSNLNTLTISTGLSGTSYNGSSAVTIAIDSTVATLTGVQTLTNKTISGASNTLSNIANASLTNSSVTYNGVAVALGASGTITAVNPNALTIGTGLSGTSYTGAAAVTIAIDSTVATLTGTQTLTNKTMSGASNTFSNISNGALSNSTISGISLGSNLNALTIGTGLSGTSYNGSSVVTVAIDSTVATLTGSQTLTNKSISGSTNTLTNIPNSALTNSSVTVGSTAISLGSTSTTLAGLTSVTLTQDPTAALQAATKQYVDNVASGINFHNACSYATTADLGSVTYNNGASGVGATLTNAGTQAALVIDGHTFTSTDATNAVRILVKNESNGAYNGIYTLTNQGSGSTNWVMTRATDYDTSGTGTNEIDAGDLVLVLYGTTNANTSWVQQTPLPITVGTTALVFVQFAAPITYTAGTGLTLTGTTFSITNTAVTAGAYGSATQTGTFTVNAQGQLTLAGNTTVTPAVGSITGLGTSVATALGVAVGTAGSFVVNGGVLGTPSSGTLTNATGLPISTGVSGLGTGVATALAIAIGSAGAPITFNGALGTPSSGTVTNLTGTASININGTVGATTASTGAFTTVSATGVITSTVATGTAPFTVASTTQVANLNAATAGTATNATNTGTTAASSGATNYLVFKTATTGNLPELVNSSITCNAATGAITGGISGGTF